MLLSDSLLEEVISGDWGLCKWKYCPFTGTLAIESSHCFAQHVNKWTQNDVSNVQYRREPSPEPNSDGERISDVLSPDMSKNHACYSWVTQPVVAYYNNINR